ncbi:TonB-dependent receptor [Kineobactrum sediminis]|nr:TonB-dependent receptor [Kineobactrum sediminis]
MNNNFSRTLIATAVVLASSQVMSQALEEIVVTAQKRAQSLQDVPVSISVVTGDALKNTGVQNLESASEYLPNFKVSRNAIQDTISIRGVNSDLQAGGDQSVGIFLDGVFRGRGVQSRFTFADMERLEVLRGPQGTLFGKNTAAGAPNITSKRPTREFEAEISATYEAEYDSPEISGYVSGALSNNVRARAFFLTREMKEGWTNNAYYDSDDPQSEEWTGRLSMDWDITDNLSAVIRYEHYDFDVNGAAYEIIQTSQIPSSLAPISTAGLASLGLIDGQLNGKTNIGPGVDPFGGYVGEMDEGTSFFHEGDGDEAAVTFNWQLDPGTVTAIIARSEYSFDRYNDADFGPLAVANLFESEDYEQDSIEVRFSSDTGGALDYIAGLYYQSADLAVSGDTQFWAPSSLGALGLNGLQRIHYLDQESDTWAIFGQVTWNISDVLRLNIGGRYTDEEKSAVQGANLYGKVAATQPHLPAPGTKLPDPLVGALNPLIEMGSGAHDNELALAEDDFSPTASLQWNTTDDTMLYASFARGFKGGGFNAFSLAGNPQDAIYDPEEATSYELGAKIALLGGTAEINVAIFHMEFADMQTTQFTGNTGFIVGNAAEATSQGFELDGRWMATKKLLLSGNVGYINFEFDDYAGAGCTGLQIFTMQQAGLGQSGADCSALGINDLSGRTNQDVPEWTASLAAEYTQLIGDNYDLRLLVDVNYSGEYYATADLDENTVQDSFVKYNASVIFGPLSGQWDLSLITRNLGDEQTFSYANDVPLFPDSHLVAVEPGRTLAVRGRYRF